MIKTTRIGLNPIELSYYSVMVSLRKCSGSCAAAEDLSTKTYISNETKYINIRVFNMITRIKEAKTLIKDISCDYKCKFNNTTCISNQNWNNETC